MNRFAFALALPLLAAACGSSTGGPVETGTETAFTAARTCAAGSVPTQLHADFPDGTSLDQDDCFSAPGMGATKGAEADFWNSHYVDFNLTSPDGATKLDFHSVLQGAGNFQPGTDLSLPSAQSWMRLTLTSSHGTADGGLGNLHLDDWKLPSLEDTADGVLSATITVTLTAADGGEIKVHLKVTGLLLDMFWI
jgi:hypothetical protein